MPRSVAGWSPSSARWRLQLDVCREQVEWATTEKRTFLRQRIEARLAALHLQMRDFTAALSLIGKLLTEVGDMDPA